MAASNDSTAELTARTLVLTRVFDAPRELVFRMWTDPKHLARWWGPKDFTNPVCEADARPGGALRIVMRGPDGNEYPMVGVFREVEAPERLVFTNVAVDGEGNPILDGLTTVTFAEEGGKTKLTLETRAVALVPYAAAYLNGMEAGWTQSLERLAERVADADREIVSTRVFAAPRELVFRAWTEPEHLARWWGPKDFTNTFHEFDPRPGGAWRFVMHGPDGANYPNESVFVEVVRPERIVLDHVSRPRFRLTATFGDLGDKTRLIFHMLFRSAADCEKVKKLAVEGNEQNFDRLAAELVKMA